MRQYAINRDSIFMLMSFQNKTPAMSSCVIGYFSPVITGRELSKHPYKKSTATGTRDIQLSSRKPYTLMSLYIMGALTHVITICNNSGTTATTCCFCASTRTYTRWICSGN